MKTVGYAIVGTGYFGAELGRIMKEQEGAKIVAVLDPENGQTIADELGCDVETDLDTLYSRDDVDAVIVATPNYLHKEPVVKAAEHGVNVFCEKYFIVIQHEMDGKNSSQLFRGKRLEKNQEVICTIIFMNWTVYSF